MKLKKETVFRAAAVFLGVFLPVVAAEMFCRLVPPRDESPTQVPRRQWQIHPYTMFHYRQNVRSETLTTNAIGFRGAAETPLYLDEVPVKTTYTIILTGGSAAFGWRASSDETVLAVQLEKILSADRPTRVINLAMPGYNAFCEFIAIARYGLMQSPDLIVAVDGFNDVALHCNPEHRMPPAFPNAFDTLQKSLLCYRPPRLGFTDRYDLAAVFKHSTLLRRLMGLRYVQIDQIIGEQERRGKVETMTETDARRIVDFYRQSEEMLVRLATSWGCGVLLATQPLRNFPGGEAEEKWRQELFGVYPRIIEAGRRVCQGKNNVVYADLIEAMPPPNEQYFYDGVHYNDAGQRKVAEILAEKLQASGLLNHVAPPQTN